MAYTVVIDCTRNCAAIKAFSSTLILTSLTPLVAYSAHTFSMTGVSCLHGPHHSAQKSTITSDVRDGSTTSRRTSRSEERRVGQECVRTLGSGVSREM